MATPPKGIITWPGLASTLGGSMTFLQGITPSVCVLECLPQDPSTLSIDGTLTISFASVTIQFLDCRADLASFEYNEAGQLIRLSILDRRWKWRFAGDDGPISGWFNQRFEGIQPAPQQWQLGTVTLGSINPDSQRTPQQLAALLLEAMGEEGYDVSQLPNVSLPEVNWDHDLPAQVLQDLCERLGCRVTLGLDDLVRVVRAGVGLALPTDSVERESDIVDPPEIPDSIMVVGGKSRYQVDLLLEAVGIDVDGVIKPIDELSYTPAGGWSNVLDYNRDLGFQEIPGWELQDVVPPLAPKVLAKAFQLGPASPRVNPRELARESVFRWYRIKTDGSADNDNQPPRIPGWDGGNGLDNDRIDALWQILPIEDVQILGWYDETNQFIPYDALVYGQYQYVSFETEAGVIPQGMDASFNWTANTISLYDYTIDRDRGLVIFTDTVQPMILLDAAALTVAPAILYLRCTVSVRDFVSSTPDRYERERDLSDMIGLNTGTHATGPRILKREEIVKNTVPQYDDDFNVLATFDNDQANDAEVDYAIDAALLEYQVQTPQDVMYMGIVPIACDGAITQVVWSVGPDGATTRAARNTEINYAVPSFRERALMAQLPRQTEAVKQLQDQSRRG